MNFCTEFSNAGKFFHVSIVKELQHLYNHCLYKCHLSFVILFFLDKNYFYLQRHKNRTIKICFDTKKNCVIYKEKCVAVKKVIKK